MPTRALNLVKAMPLRHEAESRLREGTAPKAKVAATSLDVLAVLESMCTAPGGASSALKLLHELQVHQVELDLQHEQLEQSQSELSHARDDYVERFDFAPIAYCVLGDDGKIIEGNLAASALFGLDQALLSGRRLESFVAPQSQLALLALLTQLSSRHNRARCEVEVPGSGGIVRRCHVVATVSPNGRVLIGILSEND